MTDQREIRLNEKRLEYIERLEKETDRGMASSDLKRAEWSIANLKNQCARHNNRVEAGL